MADHTTAGIDLDKLCDKLDRVSRWIDKFPVPTDGATAMMCHLRDVKEALARRSTSGSDFTVRVDMERASSTAHKVSVSMASAASRKLSQEEVDALDRNPWASGSDVTAASDELYGYVLKTGHGNKFIETLGNVHPEVRHMWKPVYVKVAAPAPAAKDAGGK